MMLSIFWKKCY